MCILIIKYLDKNNNLFNGFMKVKSTLNATVELMNFIVEVFDKKRKAMSIPLTFPKHSIMLIFVYID